MFLLSWSLDVINQEHLKDKYTHTIFKYFPNYLFMFILCNLQNLNLILNRTDIGIAFKKNHYDLRF